MSLYKRGDVWWYKFTWRGEAIRESTKQSNKRTAEQIESARKTQLARGEVGIKDRTPAPTLGAFAEDEFLPFVEKQKKGKVNTVTFYRSMVGKLKTFAPLWKSPIDKIETSDITKLIELRQAGNRQVTTINRELATLRRMFKLAAEWGRVSTTLPKVRLLPGENRRERVVSAQEEKAYLSAAGPVLRDFASLMLDCGLRPEEIHRMKIDQFRNNKIEIHTGKTSHARRSVPASSRVVAILEARGTEDWVFPAPTKSGHIDSSSLKKQHTAALKASAVAPFVLYSLRHTCLTRWAESGMDPFTLKKLAGHANIITSMRYIHMNDKHAQIAMEKVWEVQRGHKNGHNDEDRAADDSTGSLLNN